MICSCSSAGMLVSPCFGCSEDVFFWSERSSKGVESLSPMATLVDSFECPRYLVPLVSNTIVLACERLVVVNACSSSAVEECTYHFRMAEIDFHEDFVTQGLMNSHNSKVSESFAQKT